MKNSINSYTVLAILEAKPECEKDLKTLLENVVEPSRNEETCVEYRLHQGLENTRQFFFYENWINKNAHEAHCQEPHIKELAEKIGPLLAKPYEVIFGDELCGIIDKTPRNKASA